MSEYQYYEFQAIDRPLSREQMAELRAISSRAEITPTRLTNVYHWGDFRGDPVALLESYFDAHVYEANWGSHTLMFGFPSTSVDLEQANAYRVEANSEYEAGLMVQERRGRVIVTFASHDEVGGGWVDDEESEAWMPSLISLRADILNGDPRALYLGWLAGATYNPVDADEFDDEDPEDDMLEPPVPPGLGQLTAPLQQLAEFLRLDPAILDVAAEGSAPLTAVRVSVKAAREWIAALPAAEKDALLLRLVQGETQLHAELTRRLRADLGPKDAAPKSGKRRSAVELAEAGKARAAELKRRAEQQRARERSAFLDTLAEKQDEIWRQADDFAEQKKALQYDAAVALIRDLHELAVRDGTIDPFGRRLDEFRDRHARKPALLERLHKARLAP
jgi:hypothetical protein